MWWEEGKVLHRMLGKVKKFGNLANYRLEFIHKNVRDKTTTSLFILQTTLSIAHKIRQKKASVHT